MGKRKERVKCPVLLEVITPGHRTLLSVSQQLCRGFHNSIIILLCWLSPVALPAGKEGLNLNLWVASVLWELLAVWRWDVALGGAEIGMLPLDCSPLLLLAVHRSKWWFPSTSGWRTRQDQSDRTLNLFLWLYNSLFYEMGYLTAS